MIREVLVKDFQSIELLRVELGAITIFRGESRQGKSALLRAIRAVISNPKGGAFIRGKAKSCLVEIKTDAGVVSWEKSRSTSAVYCVQLAGQPPLAPFEKLSDVPREVYQVLNIADISIDKDLSLVLHFSGQHDAPFILPPIWGTASSVAKALGKITSVDRAAQAMRLCAADVKGAKVQYGEVQERIRTTSESLKAFADLDPQIAAVDALQQHSRRAEELSRVDCSANLEAARQSQSMAASAKASLELLRLVPFESFEEAAILRGVYEKEASDLAVARGLAAESRTLFEKKAATRNDCAQAEAALSAFRSENKVCPLCDSEWSSATC